MKLTLPWLAPKPKAPDRPWPTVFGEAPKPKPDKIGSGLLATARAVRNRSGGARPMVWHDGSTYGPEEIFRPATPPPGVVPQGAPVMAMDNILAGPANYAAAAFGGLGWGGWATTRWLGFPFLAELAQRPEYRMIVETWAEELTRKWITITYEGDDDRTDEVQACEAEFRRLGVQDKFRWATEFDGYFGRSHIYIDTGDSDNPAELRAPLPISKGKIRKGGTLELKTIEPMWTYPATYNANDPLSQDYYRPDSWYVFGKVVNRERLLTFVGREVPDILKAAYSFGGLSLSQMAMPYVDNWIRTRTSVGDIVNAFSIMVLATDLSVLTNGAASEELVNRIEAMTLLRDNSSTTIINKAAEDFTNISAPLGGLDRLQAQSQEHMASVSELPLVKLTGITPTGLNASSEGEIRVFYDRVAARQQKMFRTPLTRLLAIVQLHLFGEIIPGIDFKFNELWELDAAAKSLIWKTKVDGQVELGAAGAIDADDMRKAQADDQDSPFFGLQGPAPEPDPETDDPGQDPSILPTSVRTAEPRASMRNGE